MLADGGCSWHDGTCRWWVVLADDLQLVIAGRDGCCVQMVVADGGWCLQMVVAVRGCSWQMVVAVGTMVLAENMSNPVSIAILTQSCSCKV